MTAPCTDSSPPSTSNSQLQFPTRKRKLTKEQELRKKDDEDRKKEQEFMDMLKKSVESKKAKKAAKKARKEAEKQEEDKVAESTGKMFAKHLRLVRFSSPILQLRKLR